MNREKAQHLGLHQMLFQGKDGYQETTNSHAKSAMGPGGGLYKDPDPGTLCFRC